MIEQIVFNRNNMDYTATLKLPDGKCARIIFCRNIGSIPRLNYHGWIYSVGLAIGKKKDIMNWFESATYNTLTDLPTFSKYGASVLYWAKRAIEQFIEEMKEIHSQFCLSISGEDRRRQRVYEHYCLKNNYIKCRINYGGEFRGYIQEPFCLDNALVYYYNGKMRNEI